MIAAERCTRAADVQRDRSVALAVIRFALRPRLQQGNGAVTHEVVEPADDASDCRLVGSGGYAGCQHGFKDADEEERGKYL